MHTHRFIYPEDSGEKTMVGMCKCGATCRSRAKLWMLNVEDARNAELYGNFSMETDGLEHDIHNVG